MRYKLVADLIVDGEDQQVTLYESDDVAQLKRLARTWSEAVPDELRTQEFIVGFGVLDQKGRVYDLFEDEPTMSAVDTQLHTLILQYSSGSITIEECLRGIKQLTREN